LFLEDVAFYEGQNGSIVLGGFYAKDKRGGADGFYMYKLDETGYVLTNYTYEIPVEIMKQYVSERTQKILDKKESKGRELNAGEMVLRNVIFNQVDGSIALIGEKFYIKTRYNSQSGQTTYTYYYQEILMTSISKDGKMNWIKKLPKNQASGRAQNECSFYYMGGKNDHYLLFMDNVKNLTLSKDKYPFRHTIGSGGYLTGFKVNHETGAWERVSIFNSKNAKGVKLTQFNIDRIVDLDNNSFAVEYYKKKKEDVMVKVKLED
jgi:hypothetical protein